MFLHLRTKSNLDSNEIERRIQKKLDERTNTSGRSRSQENDLQGQIENGQFRLIVNESYWGSFNPAVIVTGKIQPEMDHTIIDLRVRPDLAVLAGLIFLTLVVLLNVASPLISGLFQMLVSEEGLGAAMQLPKGFYLQLILAIGAILFSFSYLDIRFSTEAERVIKYLEELFASKRIS